MPIATGHEREELEAALEVFFLLFRCAVSFFRFDIEKMKKDKDKRKQRHTD